MALKTKRSRLSADGNVSMVNLQEALEKGMAETGRNLHHMLQMAREGQCNWTSTPKTALGILSKYTAVFQELLILCPNTAVNKTKIAQGIYQCHIDGGEVSKLATFSKDDAGKVGEVIRITLSKLRKRSADEKQFQRTCSMATQHEIQMLRSLLGSVHYNESQAYPLHVAERAFEPPAAIKKMICDHIALATFDEASAADGSCPLEQIAERSARLGDGFSKNPKDRDALLEARTKDLSALSGQLRGFDLDEYLGEGVENDEVVAWAVGNDAVPEQKIGVAAAGQARVLLVMDYSRDTSRTMVDTRATLERAMPGISLELRASFGPVEDDEGIASQFDGAVGRLTGVKRIKRIRVDLLTSCAKLLRDAAGFLPDFVIGFVQGGVVAALIRWPLVVELTLQARNLQLKEVQKVGSAWSKIKCIWCVNPRVWKSQIGAEDVTQACPELKKKFSVEPLKGFGVSTKHGRPDDTTAMFEALGLAKVDGLDELNLRSLLSEPAREVWEHEGLCVCGRRTYLFSRCPACIEKEAHEVLESIMEEECARGSFELESELGLDVDVLATRGHEGFKSLSVKILESWRRAGKEIRHQSQCETKFGELSVLLWKSVSDSVNFGKGKASLPYISTWVVDSNGVVLPGHHCCREEVSAPSKLRWGGSADALWSAWNLLALNRIAGDGVLEKEVQLKTGQTVWAPVVPDGVVADDGVTWRKSCYFAVHGGVLGAHRSAEEVQKTLGALVRELGAAENWHEAHAEDCILVPADSSEESRAPIVFDEPGDEGPSLGQQASGEARQVEFTLQRRGRDFVLRIGDKAHPPSRIDFWEIFAGQAGLTLAARQRGLSVAPPLDRLHPAVGKTWDLTLPVDQELFWCLHAVLEPAVVHAGPPCERYSVMGQREPNSSDHAVRNLVIRVLSEQEKGGRKGTAQSPTGSLLWSEADWIKSFGVPPLEGIPSHNAVYSARADRKEWDMVKADLSVYQYSGQQVKEDPRRTDAYRQEVVKELGFGDDWKERRAGLSEADVAACREVVERKSGRVVDGRYLTDDQAEDEIRQTCQNAPVEAVQPAGDALEALGVKVEHLMKAVELDGENAKRRLEVRGGWIRAVQGGGDASNRLTVYWVAGTKPTPGEGKTGFRADSTAVVESSVRNL
ncbi:Retrovirus-related Pol polyprotein from transposon opus [Durusdinium trenchii]|uniref:Retrovirus-related Pol polyprotein from transposon opus n=1 Tax=Durusdinium trenchii TaxID=1381693 RepID=A0ABP0M647_9DINO